MMKRNGIIVIVMFFLIASCQDENFETPSYSKKVVVDGWIEQGQHAKVFLTWSCPYFSEVDSISILNLMLTSAKVTVSDGSFEEILMLRRNDAYFPPYVYESNTLRGVTGRTYSLKVEYGGHTITASTQIPESQPIDSLWFSPANGVDTTGYIMLRFPDKIGVDNYYRILTKKSSATKYTPVFLPNLDGSLVDGQIVTMSLTEENSETKPKLFNVNDTVSVKLYTMNYLEFKFWNSLYSEHLNTTNPFAASNLHVQSNINGGLGVWAGYGTSIKQIVCK
jgi:hypothetical protein